MVVIEPIDPRPQPGAIGGGTTDPGPAGRKFVIVTTASADDARATRMRDIIRDRIKASNP